jgi:hypothetical protein
MDGALCRRTVTKGHAQVLAPNIINQVRYETVARCAQPQQHNYMKMTCFVYLEVHTRNELSRANLLEPHSVWPSRHHLVADQAWHHVTQASVVGEHVPYLLREKEKKCSKCI